MSEFPLRVQHHRVAKGFDSVSPPLRCVVRGFNGEVHHRGWLVGKHPRSLDCEVIDDDGGLCWWNVQDVEVSKSAAERECEQLRTELRQLRDLVKGLRKAVKDDETEWVDANIVRLLLDRLDSGEVWTEAPDHASYQDAYPWSQCRDVDPFTGQPDQHEHGDACPDCTDLPEDRH